MKLFIFKAYYAHEEIHRLNTLMRKVDIVLFILQIGKLTETSHP